MMVDEVQDMVDADLCNSSCEEWGAIAARHHDAMTGDSHTAGSASCAE